MLRIISSPRILTLDNRKARISQGTLIPFSQISAQGVQTTFQEAKLQLLVTPHVTAEGSVAVDLLEQMTTERTVEAFLDWQQRRTGWPQAWQEHTGIGESSVYLTQAELAGIVEAMDALLMRYIDERPIDDVTSRPEGSVPVTFTLFAVPGGPPPGPETATEA